MILLISLIVIIFVHELGHLIAAKFFKCGCPEFSVGFGPTLFSKKIGETTYKLKLLLLGGYVVLQDELNYSESPMAFTNKTYSQKVIISLAGIIVNIVTGVISLLLGLHFYNEYLYLFGFYSIGIALTNALPIPCLDGSFWIMFLFENKIGKKKLYPIVKSIFSKWFKWIMVLNILSLPFLGYMIYKGYIL